MRPWRRSSQAIKDGARVVGTLSESVRRATDAIRSLSDALHTYQKGLDHGDA